MTVSISVAAQRSIQTIRRQEETQANTQKTPVMAMVQRPNDDKPGAPAGDARVAVVTGLSLRGAERVIETQIAPDARLMSDEAKAFMAIGESFAEHETIKHSGGEYVRDAVHVNSVEGFNSRVRRTIAGVFHHMSPQHADLYSTRSASAGRSVSSQAVPFAKPDMAAQSCEPLVARASSPAGAECLSRGDRASDAPKPGWRHQHQISRICFWLIKARFGA